MSQPQQYSDTSKFGLERWQSSNAADEPWSVYRSAASTANGATSRTEAVREADPAQASNSNNVNGSSEVAGGMGLAGVGAWTDQPVVEPKTRPCNKQ